jgi:hypothetical protein
MTKGFLAALPNDSANALLPASDQTRFQENVCNILYLASQSRPDLSYAITQLSLRSNKCTFRDMKAVNRLLNYIFLTRDLGLTLGSTSGDWELHAFVDASYDCYPDSKSHSGISLHLGLDSEAFLCYQRNSL